MWDITNLEIEEKYIVEKDGEAPPILRGGEGGGNNSKDLQNLSYTIG